MDVWLKRLQRNALLHSRDTYDYFLHRLGLRPHGTDTRPGTGALPDDPAGLGERLREGRTVPTAEERTAQTPFPITYAMGGTPGRGWAASGSPLRDAGRAVHCQETCHSNVKK